MTRSLKTLGMALAMALVLVICVDYTSYAATGHSFILGKINKANKATTLKRTTNGPALNLVTKTSSVAPLVVNGTGKVTNLNADKVDGVDAAALQNNVIRYTLPASSGASSYTWNLPGLPAGTYLATYSVYVNSGAAPGQCWFIKPSSSVYKVVSNAAPAVFGTYTYNASGVVNTNEISQFHCTGGGSPFTVDTSAAGPTELTFTRIDSLSGAASAFRTASNGARVAR